MDFLAEILSSKARAEFFRILFGVAATECHLREIQRRSGLAIGTIRQEAIKLVRIGLITKRDDGNRTYYSANKNHPVYGDIHSIVLKTAGLADIFIPAFNADKLISYAFIFGSIAAGKESSRSDIDLFVIGDIGLRALIKLLKEPSLKTGREINPHIMTSAEFINRKKNKEHFITTVLESPIMMIKGDADAFKRLGE
jgi:DNA-binding transcriptional ArsR family regulator